MRHEFSCMTRILASLTLAKVQCTAAAAALRRLLFPRAGDEADLETKKTF